MCKAPPKAMRQDGTTGCDSCEMLNINGVNCHEQGCPDAWRDREIECVECGFMFQPETRGEVTCSPCCHAHYAGHVCDCEHCLDERYAERGALYSDAEEGI